MSIWNGTMGIRFFTFSELTVDASGVCPVLKSRTLPAMEEISGYAEGWSGPDGLLDRDMTDGHVSTGGSTLRLNHVRAERRVSENMQAALVAQECGAWMKASGADAVPRNVRAEIKDAVRKRLMKETPPALDGIGAWIDLRQRTMAAEATSDAKVDRLSAAFRDAFGTYPVMLTPETAAFRLYGVDRRGLVPCSFSPEADAPVEVDLGMEFLTWLFWRYDVTGGEFRVELHGPQYGYMLEGPLTFFAVGQGAHEVVIRKGSPLNSREAAACLRAGKLLCKARFVMVQDDRLWTCAVDSSFAFTALKLPYGEPLSGAEKLVERSMMINEFLEAWTALYGQFIEQRSSSKWNETAHEIYRWIDAKSGGTP